MQSGFAFVSSLRGGHCVSYNSLYYYLKIVFCKSEISISQCPKILMGGLK